MEILHIKMCEVRGCKEMKKWWQFWKKESCPKYEIKIKAIHFDNEIPDDMRDGFNFHHDCGDRD